MSSSRYFPGILMLFLWSTFWQFDLAYQSPMLGTFCTNISHHSPQFGKEFWAGILNFEKCPWLEVKLALCSGKIETAEQFTNTRYNLTVFLCKWNLKIAHGCMTIQPSSQINASCGPPWILQVQCPCLF